MQKILITGGTGFIGSHTVAALCEAGYEVTIIDNLSNSFMEVLDGIEKITATRPDFHNIDLKDQEALSAFFKEHPFFNGVIHFAAYKAVGESVEQPLKYYQNNLGSLTNLIDCMNRSGVNNLVFSSSCTVYGQPDELPVTEKSPIKKAESPYGNTKVISEQIIEDVVKTGGLNAISLRYFNPIGAHPSALIGELPIGVPNNLIPVVTQTAIGIRDKITVYGEDYPTPDGSCIRDYIHVTDLARAHVVALKRLIGGNQKSNYEVFNLGTGTGYSVLEVLNTFEKVSGLKLNFEIGPRRNGDIMKIFADTTYANMELSWKAEEGLESMIRSAWAWQQKLGEMKFDI
jgi:UDP-glucose 4-epimerase